MRTILMAVAILGVAGGAYATGSGELTEVRAADIKASAKLNPGPAAAVAVSVEKADRVYDIRCKYNDAYEENMMARFSLAGSYKVSGADSATLSYEATITYLNVRPATVVFSVGKDLMNERYAGVNYPGHFKFPLEWHGVDATIERANLIISKEPVSVGKDQYGATIRTFSGALDVRYNDHHGDYVKTICTQREFEN